MQRDKNIQRVADRVITLVNAIQSARNWGYYGDQEEREIYLVGLEEEAVRAIEEFQGGGRRFCLIQDDSGHSYVCPEEHRASMVAIADGDWEEWETKCAKFGVWRVDNPNRLTFTNPREE